MSRRRSGSWSRRRSRRSKERTRRRKPEWVTLSSFSVRCSCAFFSSLLVLLWLLYVGRLSTWDGDCFVLAFKWRFCLAVTVDFNNLVLATMFAILFNGLSVRASCLCLWSLLPFHTVGALSEGVSRQSVGYGLDVKLVNFDFRIGSRKAYLRTTSCIQTEMSPEF